MDIYNVMENNNILKSFELQKDLNSKIWKKSSNGSYNLDPKIREKLLEIAYEFIESLNVDVVVSDVHLTGSLVNYNWSEYSDFDLHIIADFKQFPKNKLSLYEELFKLKKTIFNSEQNIKIYGYDVEVFVQDENEKGHSAGIFSLISNDWIQKPKKKKFEVDKSVLNRKIEQWKNKIDDVLDSANDEKDLQKSKKLIDNLKDKLKDYRKIGLEKNGEMSYENLVFKYLRRSGHIEKLFSFKKERLDKELSIKESSSKLRDTLQSLGYEEKGSEITSGGEITPEIATIVSEILQKFKKINPSADVRITGGNDKYHEGTSSKHNVGMAVDLTVEPPSARRQFLEILKDYKKTNPKFVYIDEYTNPSRRATAGHFHLQIGGVQPVEQGKSYENLVDEISKSEFLEKIKKLALSDKTLKRDTDDNINYDADVENVQISLQFLGHSLPIWGVDGLFGPETEDAVKSFQKKYYLSETGVLSSKDLKYLLGALILNKFQESDLSKINFEGGYNQNLLDVSENAVPSDFESMTKIIINSIEGGYYNPSWHFNSSMGRSGETMFGMDRKFGEYLFKTGTGKSFWDLIDKNKSEKTWTHNYRGGNISSQLISMVSKIMSEEYERNSDKYLTPEAKKIVDSNNGLRFHFFYACWNGEGFFRMFARKINKAIKDGIKEPIKLLSIAINSRLDSNLMKKSGEIFLKIFKNAAYV